MTFKRTLYILGQVASLAAQVYVAYLNGGKPNAVNVGIGLLQVGLADHAYKQIPPVK